ncbi:MAG: flagellar hook-basal body complex protein FliE [Firmicutes bacterium]|jgi:flagellar hook-basal body complex protein FliE|nr:flagellar hook-basal body complex protein FliE [Bacillota bacterium]
MINQVGLLPPLSSVVTEPNTTTKVHGFQNVLASALEEVNRLQLDAQGKTRILVAGGDIELHEIMLAVQKAELALELTQTVRNKVVETYQEIMRMQV